MNIKTKRIFKKRAVKIKDKFIQKFNLSDIRIEFDTNNISFCVNEVNNQVFLKLSPYNLIKECIINHDKGIFLKTSNLNNSISKRIKFIILHELSHYYHYSKYNKSFNIEKESYFLARQKRLNNLEYRKLGVEKKADTIAYSQLLKV